ncbi:MAG: PilZ domain-containing protein [Myxococcales bacterium]|nr:PilZ domain-containing protein [Myxococcales bacterium]
MIDVAPSPVLQERSSRSAFKYPVRVTIAGERVVRLLSGDLSPNGMFLQMNEPPEAGTVVVLAFEVRGQVLPFAEGEVAWRRGSQRGGFGVRFTRFLHPRAQALIEYLAANVESGAPLKPFTPPARRWRWASRLATAAALATFLLAVNAPEPGPVMSLDPSLACAGAETVETAGPAFSAGPAVSVTPAVKLQPPRKRARVRLPQGPKQEAPTLARTAPATALPGRFSSTPLPSGAARLVNVSRVGGALRVAIDPVAGGRVTAVTAIQSPPRLVIDVAGTSPTGRHAVALADPELERISVSRNGAGTRLIFSLKRAPGQVAQHGDSALVTY